MLAVCIDEGPFTSLEKGERYNIFDHGPHNVYVSRFGRNAHFGSYPRNVFKVMENEWPQEPQDGPNLDDLDSGTKYKAELIYRPQGYSMVALGEYIIKLDGSLFYFYDCDTGRCRGAYPPKWFDNIRPLGRVQDEPNPLPVMPDQIPVIASAEVERIEQMNIFDFI